MTPKITLSKKALTTLGSKYCVVTITEETNGKHRFIEDATGGLRLTFGVGKWEDVTLRQFQTIIRSIIQSAKHHQLEYLALDPYAAQFPQLHTYSDTHLASFVIENILLAHYEFTTYKSKKKEYQGIKEIVLIGDGKAIADGIKRGTIVGTLTNAARDIANTHGDDLTPKVLADKAKSLAKGTAVSVSVLGRKDIIKQKLNLIHAVGKGSHNEEQLIVMEYWGAGKGTKTKKSRATNYSHW